MMGTVTRQHGYSHRWIERSMQPVLTLVSTLPLLSPQQRHEADKGMMAIVSDERGQQTVDITLLDTGGILWQRRYGSQGVLPPVPAASEATPLWTAQSLKELTAPRWHEPQVKSSPQSSAEFAHYFTLRYSAPIFKPLPDGSRSVTGVCTISLDTPWLMDMVRSFSSFENCLIFFITPSGQWTLPPDADATLAPLKTLVQTQGGGELSVTYKDQTWLAVLMPLADKSLYMGVLIPKANLFAGLNKLTQSLALCGIAVLVLAAVSLHHTSVRLLSPLTALRALAKRRLAVNCMPRRTPRRPCLRPAPLPPLPGVEMAAFMHTDAGVRGDLYDYFLSSPLRLCCVMGNVTESGVPAALLMGRLGPLLHELLLSGLTPGRALENINRMLTSATPADGSTYTPHRAVPMTSVLAGILDMHNGLFRWASAGQFPPQHCKGNTVEPLEWTSNVPLGIRMEETYHEKEVQLKPGEILLFVGQRLLSLTGAEGEWYTEEHMHRFWQNRQEGLDELLPLFFAHICQTLGRTPQDDLTFLAVRWQPDTAK